MGVIADVILAVAVIAAAAGIVTELQFRVGQIGTAADGAFMPVGRLDGGGAGLVGTSVGEGDCLRLFTAGSLAEQPSGVGLPGHGDYIAYILAKEQEVIGKGDDGEQIIGVGIGEQSDDHQDQIQ